MFLSENWFLYPLALVRARGGHLVPPAGDAHRGGDHRRHGVRLLQLGRPARRLRQGPGVEPADAAVLDPDAVPARRLRDRRAGAPPRGRRHVGDPGRTAVRCWGKRPSHRPRRSTSDAEAPEAPEAPEAMPPPDATRPPRIPRHGMRLVAMAVLAAIVTTVCLVIVQNERDFIPYWARYNYTGYESGEHRQLHRQVVVRVPRLPRHREQPGARAHAVGGRRRDRRVRHAARAHAPAVLDARAHPVDGRASTSRPRPPRRTTS